MQTFLIDPLGCDFAELALIGHVALENFSQHLTRALVHFRHSRMVINVGVKKFSQRGVRFLQLFTVTNEGSFLPANVIRAFWIRLGN